MDLDPRSDETRAYTGGKNGATDGDNSNERSLGLGLLDQFRVVRSAKTQHGYGECIVGIWHTVSALLHMSNH